MSSHYTGLLPQRAKILNSGCFYYRATTDVLVRPNYVNIPLTVWNQGFCVHSTTLYGLFQFTILSKRAKKKKPIQIDWSPLKSYALNSRSSCWSIKHESPWFTAFANTEKRHDLKIRRIAESLLQLTYDYTLYKSSDQQTCHKMSF